MSRFVSAALCALLVCSMTSADAKGAPKLGDKAAWAPRIKQGIAVLNNNSIKGFKGKVGMMMPKGGHPNLSDTQIVDAVAYIVQQSK